MPIKFADVLGVEIWEMFDCGHEVNLKELLEAMNKLLKESDEEKLRLAVTLRVAVKILRAVVR